MAEIWVSNYSDDFVNPLKDAKRKKAAQEASEAMNETNSERTTAK